MTCILLRLLWLRHSLFFVLYSLRHTTFFIYPRFYPIVQNRWGILMCSPLCKYHQHAPLSVSLFQTTQYACVFIISGGVAAQGGYVCFTSYSVLIFSRGVCSLYALRRCFAPQCLMLFFKGMLGYT